MRNAQLICTSKTIQSSLGFAEIWIDLNFWLISDCWFSVLVNGEACGFFHSSRGLRQGDPISPCLFIIAAEVLCRGLNSLHIQSPSVVYNSYRLAPVISHLAYADDILIFCNGGKRSLIKHMEFLACYQAFSGQLINMQKSCFITGKSGTKMCSFSSPSKEPASPSLYLVPAAAAHSPSIQTSPGHDLMASTPWSHKRSSSAKEISSVAQLEQFLADVDERFSESAGKMATSPPTITGFGIAGPSTITASTNTSGTKRSTPLRPVRMSPGSQKFSTPPKKGEGDLPPPMCMEESIEAFERLGICPQIEQWRDSLGQWFLRFC